MSLLKLNFVYILVYLFAYLFVFQGCQGVEEDVKLDANETQQETVAFEEVYSALASPDDGVVKAFPAPRRKATHQKGSLKEVASLTGQSSESETCNCVFE